VFLHYRYVSGLCDGEAIEAKIFNFKQKFKQKNYRLALQFRPAISKPLLAVVF